MVFASCQSDDRVARMLRGRMQYGFSEIFEYDRHRNKKIVAVAQLTSCARD
jgi:hypothetical protein